MQNVYSTSGRQMKRASSVIDDDDDDYENVGNISQTPAVPTREKTDCKGKKEDLQVKFSAFDIVDDDDDDDDDYENASDLSKKPAVPIREKNIEITGKKEELKLKYLPKPVTFSHTQDHPNVAPVTRPAPLFQPPHIGLDFSSPAVNSAFKQLPDEPNSKNNHGSRLMKLVLVMCIILILLMLILIIIIMFIYYPSISNQLSDIKLNVSEIQETARIDSDFGTEERRQLNQTFGKKIDNIETEIMNIKRAVGLCRICPTDWILLEGTCYYLSKSHKIWEESRQDCINRGSTLLLLNNKKELDLLLTRIGNKRYWIGLRRVLMAWKWVDGTAPTFTNWNSGEPNNFGHREHCTEMITGGWNDLDCTSNIDYICERLADC
ncbi:uncharacterized protein [Pyxicephalus adspersus]|uniref:uncharacterized protein isoform X2 n=1 Tax=Pyxicephalus adspersus TaxID=30357 RepID=UPI003B5AD503